MFYVWVVNNQKSKGKVLENGLQPMMLIILAFFIVVASSQIFPHANSFNKLNLLQNYRSFCNFATDSCKNFLNPFIEFTENNTDY